MRIAKSDVCDSRPEIPYWWRKSVPNPDRSADWSTEQFCIISSIIIRCSISFPEAAILLVSDGDRDLSPGPTSEVRDSRTSRRSAHAQSQVWQIWLALVSIYCVYKAIQNQNVVGPGQGSRFFQHMSKGTPGDEVVRYCDSVKYEWQTRLLRFVTFAHLPFSVRSFDLFCRFTRVYEGHFNV